MRRLLAWIRSLFSPAGAGRTTGRPTSANGASSFHLQWDTPQGSFHAASVDLEIAALPEVDELYFWALQANFRDATSEFGGGHLGLQWDPRFPGNLAANWGGYADQRLGGQVLTGTESALPSTPHDRNTRDFPWAAGTTYRLEISATPDRPGWWRGTITNVATGVTVIVRDLEGGGDRLDGFVVWSEVFARCDHPSVSARWSDLRVRRVDGAWVEVGSVTVNYQSHRDGGCDNTNATIDGAGFLQTTNTDRTTPQGTRLSPA